MESGVGLLSWAWPLFNSLEMSISSEGSMGVLIISTRGMAMFLESLISPEWMTSWVLPCPRRGSSIVFISFPIRDVSSWVVCITL